MGLYWSTIEGEQPLTTMCGTILCSISRYEALLNAASRICIEDRPKIVACNSVSHNFIYFTDENGIFYKFKVSDYI